MKIVICLDSFKDSISALQAGKILKEALEKRKPQAKIINFPLADGSEGTLECIHYNLNTKLNTEIVSGPFLEPHKVKYAIIGNTAVVELAEISGLQLVPPDRRDPGKISTYGLGELIAKLSQQGFAKIVVALGGSSSCDGGIGMAAALGYKFLDKKGNVLEPNGDNLIKITDIFTPQLPHIAVTAACDVSNPLLGSSGAAAIYAPQKGADEQKVKQLEAGLANLANLIKQKWNKDVSKIAGAGAAGGMAAGLITFLQANLTSGAEYIMQMCNFENEISNADLLITGEGSLDSHIDWGKLVGKVLEKAKDKPVIAITGHYQPDINLNSRFQQIISLEKLSGSMKKSMLHPQKYLQKAAEVMHI